MGLYGDVLTKKGNIMDITLGQVVSVALIQHSLDSTFGEYCTTLVIYTEKGKVTLNLFGDKPLVIQLGDNE
jgi:hypothetical protein